MSMLIATAAMKEEAPTLQWTEKTDDGVEVFVYQNYPNNVGTVPAYQFIYEHKNYNKQEVIAYIHTDVTINEKGWDLRVMQEFKDPQVAIVGMGGAIGIGVHDIYKKPYAIEQLQRIDYYSNVPDWQVHGKREIGSRDVAVVDGFFLAVRTSFLDKIGGWNWFPYTFHCYDTCLCLMAIRNGYKVRMVGIDAEHHGGGGSTTPEYKKWCEQRGTTMEREHSDPHLWMFNEFRDLLPYQVRP